MSAIATLKKWRLRQQRCLEVHLRPAMLARSVRSVGLIDITVGNAGASAHRNVPPRDAARRTTSLRKARAAGGCLGGSRAFSGRARSLSLNAAYRTAGLPRRLLTEARDRSALSERVQPRKIFSMPLTNALACRESR